MNWLPAAGAAVVGEQLTLGVEVAVQDLQTPLTPEPRIYWERRGPKRWEQVTVRVRYAGAPRPGEAGPVLPDLELKGHGVKNVLVERADGSKVVKPVRELRVRKPG